MAPACELLEALAAKSCRGSSKQHLVEELALAIESGELPSHRDEGSILRLFNAYDKLRVCGVPCLTTSQFSRLLHALAARPEACNPLERRWVDEYLAAREASGQPMPTIKCK